MSILKSYTFRCYTVSLTKVNKRTLNGLSPNCYFRNLGRDGTIEESKIGEGESTSQNI